MKPKPVGHHSCHILWDAASFRNCMSQLSYHLSYASLGKFEWIVFPLRLFRLVRSFSFHWLSHLNRTDSPIVVDLNVAFGWYDLL